MAVTYEALATCLELQVRQTREIEAGLADADAASLLSRNGLST